MIRSRPYDPARLARGARRAVKRLGDGEYAVQGNERLVYYVNLNSDLPCDCADSQYRGARGPCLHECAARLHAGDSTLIMALGEQLLKAEQFAKANHG